MVTILIEPFIINTFNGKEKRNLRRKGISC